MKRSTRLFVLLLSAMYLIGCGQTEIVPVPVNQIQEPDEPALEPAAEIETPEPAMSTPAGAYPEPSQANSSVAIESYPEPEGLTADSEQLSIVIHQAYPHNAGVFTQGLVWEDGGFYESGGLYGESALYRVNLEDGATVQRMPIDANYFGEGIAVVEDRIVMLTWKAGVAVVFDKESFDEIGRFNYQGEGWGLCYDEGENKLWMSNGSNTIVSRNPETFVVIDKIEVMQFGQPINLINELECVDGLIYANVWKTDRIIAIDKTTGAVVHDIDASVLLTDSERAQLVPGRQVLNGIAYNHETGRFFLTGKEWPKLFEVSFEPLAN